VRACVPDGYLCFITSNNGKDEVSFISALSQSNHPKSPLSNTIILGVRIPTYEFVIGTDFQTWLYFILGRMMDQLEVIVTFVCQLD
jgi:hypothetical protein